MTEQILLAAENDVIAVETTVPMAVDRNVLAAEKMPVCIPRIATGASRNPPIIMCAKVMKVFVIIDAMNPRSGGFGCDEPLLLLKYTFFLWKKYSQSMPRNGCGGKKRTISTTALGRIKPLENEDVSTPEYWNVEPDGD